MKSLVRSFAIFSFALYFLPQIIPGFIIAGGIGNLFLGALALALLYLIIKPILTIISFPVNMLSLGLFSLLTNALIVYLLTIIVPSILVSPFHYNKISFMGFITPVINFNTFFAYVYSAFILSCINSGIRWLMK
jgi:putative membrane protein